MPRIEAVSREAATEETAVILDAVKSKMGMVPNLISTMAQSPAVAKAYLGFSQALGGGELPARLREQIALAVGETSQCGYCVAAHTVLGKGAGLDQESTLAARRASASDAKENAALTFAKKIVDLRGNVTDDDVLQLREAGYNDGEIGEIVANVALNLFTNYFNHVAGTEIDFPAAPALVSA